MKKSLFLLSAVLFTYVFFTGPLKAHAATYPEIQDTAPNGTPGNSSTNEYSVGGENTVSEDNRYVVFESDDDNLVPNDTNSAPDVFIHDRQTNITQIISKAADGTPGDNASRDPKITSDGRYVVYYSNADNLVPNDTNGTSDIFIWDRQTGQNQRLSVGVNGTQPNSDIRDISISADARYIVILSNATNLDPSYPFPGRDGYFVFDRQTGSAKAINTLQNNDSYEDHSSITPDGRYIGYSTPSGAYLYDQQTGIKELIGVSGNSNINVARDLEISSDGRYITYFATKLTPAISINVYVYDRQAHTTELMSKASDGTQGNNYSLSPYISPDGRYVTFTSLADNLVPNDTNQTFDTFIHDRQTGLTKRISVDASGIEGNADSGYITPFSSDQHYILFRSGATNFVSNDVGQTYNLFLTTNPFDPPVTNHAPTVGTVTVTPSTANVNTSVSVSASFADADTSDTHTATINWGDGTATQSGTVTESSGSGTVSGTHTYTATGSHTVTVKVTDNAGASATGTTTATVIPAAGLTLGNLNGDDFSGANLSGQNMLGTQARGTNFTGANLSGTTLTLSNDSGANFTNANLTNANFSLANVRNANFTGANLTGANFTLAQTAGAIYSNTICPNGQNSNAHNNSCAGQGGGL